MTAELLPATKAASPQPRLSLVQKFAARFSIEPGKLMSILKATAFKVRDGEVSDEQMAALLVVADQYDLNPFTREIFAFPDKQNGIVPVVGVDGWSRIINDHPQADGIEFRYADELVTLPDAQPCPVWCEVVIYRKDRGHPTIVREYLDECYRPAFVRKDGSKASGPWQTHTRRFLRHKTLIQGARIAFGFGGIYDEDEAARVIEATAVRVEDAPPSGTAALRAAAERARQTVHSGSNGEPEAEAMVAAGGAGEAAYEPVVAAGGEVSPDLSPLELSAEAQEGLAALQLTRRVADHIAMLDEATSAKEVEDLAKAAPADVRAHQDYLAAVEKRRAALSKGGRGGK